MNVVRTVERSGDVTDLSALDGRLIAWSEGASNSIYHRTAYLLDLTTGSISKIAQAGEQGGLLDPVRLGGSASAPFLMYVDLAALPGDDRRSVAWSMWLRDVHGGQLTRVTSAGTQLVGLIPFPEGGARGFVWLQENGDPIAGGDLNFYDLRAGAIRKLAHVIGGDPDIDGDFAYVRSCPAGNCDIYRIALDGGGLERVTTSGNVATFEAHNGGLAWTEGPGGDTGQQSSEWFSPATGPLRPHQVAHERASPAVPGRGFVLLPTTEVAGLIVATSDGRVRATVSSDDPSISAAWLATNDIVVYVTTTLGGPSTLDTLHVVRVVLGT